MSRAPRPQTIPLYSGRAHIYYYYYYNYYYCYDYYY